MCETELSRASTIGDRQRVALRAPAPAAGTGGRQSAARWPLALFFISLSIPVPFEVGGLQLSPDRLFVLLATVPLTIAWLRGVAGRITGADICMALFAAWMVLTYLVNNGVERLPYAAATASEVFGGYLAGRILVRNFRDYGAFLRWFFAVLTVLFVFSFAELRSGGAIMQEFAQSLFGASYSDINQEPRLGLHRVQSIFEHPILMGLFCSIGIANALYFWGASGWKWLSKLAISLFLVFSSLSSGPFLSALLQVGLLVYGRLFRGRWKLLIAGFACIFVFLELASNRGPVILLIETLTFNPQTGWTRVKIWEFGSAEVLRHPIFGIGLNDWIRPFWLGASVDNFWLLMAMRHGLVGFGFLALAFGLHIRAIVRAEQAEMVRRVRMVYLIALISVCFTLVTVHIWGPASIFVMAYLGAGAWMYDAGNAPEAAAEQPESAPRFSAYTRQTRRVHGPARGAPRPPADHNRRGPHVRHLS